MTKRAIPLIVQVFFLLGSCNTGTRNDLAALNSDPDCVQIVLLHMEKRCESCKAVEHETILLLEEEYNEELINEKVKFVPLDYQSEKGKLTAKQLQATGQTLFVIKEDSISDLTSAAFMFAHTYPERYRKALRTEIDKFLE